MRRRANSCGNLGSRSRPQNGRRPPWHASGKSRKVMYNPAIAATHSPDTGMHSSLSAWWTPQMTQSMADKRQMLHDTSSIVDLLTRVRMTRQMEAQYARMQSSDSQDSIRWRSPSEASIATDDTTSTRELLSRHIIDVQTDQRAGQKAVDRPARRRPQSAVAHSSALRKQRDMEFGTLKWEQRQCPIYSDRLSGLLTSVVPRGGGAHARAMF
eukprot:gb/GFBE01062373.1/.p1 GENE.gb/GFBE01062373.1/~~gb/GFBE01062373.1/.p1  ORF type:complete len:212 (+),score=12.73 gb/GFBE01062373.1/:1-636(+)